MLPPRMTTGQRDAIASPASGLIIYNTTTNSLEIRNSSARVLMNLSPQPTQLYYSNRYPKWMSKKPKGFLPERPNKNRR
ncbi:MAG: hypothetical protein IPG79_10535 [Saprospiraceae bacterium]|nr:hypothetical protein [Saprospiraceae bacterium]